MEYKLVPVLLISVMLCAGCSVLSGGNGVGYEVAETPLDQAQSEVVATPTEFFVPNQDDRFAWERAKYFLENYTGKAAANHTVISKMVGSRWGLQNGPNAGDYSYEVWKDPIGNGYRYVVGCAPRSEGVEKQQQARLNASNLSRFIAQGKLELALLN